jgi:5-methylcytosine-specific restriction endonuclease McrA
MRGRERSVLCSFPGCGEILNEPGRCAEHRREGYNWRGPRLAGYDSTRWKRTSVRIRRERPTCERCGVRPSAHVHHRRHLHWPDPGFFDPDELEALCAPCHRTVTGRHAAMVKQGRANTGRASVSSPRLQAASGGQPLGLTGRRPSSDPLERRAIAVPQRLHRCWIEARKAT